MGAFPAVGDDYGRYRIKRLLGRGGMGVVFEALDTVLDRAVALKLVLPTFSDDEEFNRRFQREASVLARLRSRHIVQILDHGTHEGTIYLVTEYFQDGDLHTWLTRHGPLSPAIALTLIGNLCEGLADAHAKGVVHRDVKPSNVLLWSREDGRLIPFLCDFGIASDGEQGFTRTDALIGSPAYMAPERHLGQPATAQGDLYSLGCLLWVCIAGKPPYSGTDYQLMAAHLGAPIPQAAGSGDAVDRLNAILLSTLAKQPDERPATAKALGELATQPLEQTSDVKSPHKQVLESKEDYSEVDARGLAAQHASDTLLRREPALPPPTRPDRAKAAGNRPTLRIGKWSRRQPKRPSRGRAITALVAATIISLSAGTVHFLLPYRGDEPPKSAPSLTDGSSGASPESDSRVLIDRGRCWDGTPISAACAQTPTGPAALRNAVPLLGLKEFDSAESVPSITASAVGLNLPSDCSVFNATENGKGFYGAVCGYLSRAMGDVTVQPELYLTPYVGCTFSDKSVTPATVTLDDYGSTQTTYPWVYHGDNLGCITINTLFSRGGAVQYNFSAIISSTFEINVSPSAKKVPITLEQAEDFLAEIGATTTAKFRFYRYASS